MTMKSFDLYGYPENELEGARAAIEHALRINLTAHSSDYWGDDYVCRRGDEDIQLHRNLSEIEQAWTEESFCDFPVILYVNSTQRPREIEDLLICGVAGIRLLRREALE